MESYEGSSIRTSSVVAEEAEISPDEKAAAFVNNSPFGAQSSRPQLEAITDSQLNVSAFIGRTTELNYAPVRHNYKPQLDTTIRHYKG